MTPRNDPWAFVVEVPQREAGGEPLLRSELISPPREQDFVHAASTIATHNGLVAFWYRAPFESAPDAEVVSARMEGAQWSGTTVVTNSGRVSRDIGIEIGSLANPVPFRRSENEIWLFFVASRLGGWATSAIMLMRSSDDGLTWGPAQQLYASPVSNMSHLTKAVPVRFSDGRIGLPAYHEMGQKYPVLLILDEDGRVIDRRRMGGGGRTGLQPSIVVTGESTAIAFIRRLPRDSARRILVSRTGDGGQTWSRPAPIELPNPGGPISAIRYDDTRILLAFNDDGTSERNIEVALSNLEGTRFQRVGRIAEIKAGATGDLLMYPFLSESRAGEFNVVYSRPAKSISRVTFSSGWVERNLQLKAALR